MVWMKGHIINKEHIRGKDIDSNTLIKIYELHENSYWFSFMSAFGLA